MRQFKKKLYEETMFSNGIPLPEVPQKAPDPTMIVWRKLYDFVKNETRIKLDVEILRSAFISFDDEVLPEEAIFKLINVAMKGYVKLDSVRRTIVQYMELLGILSSLTLSLNGPQCYIINVNPEM